MFRISPVHRLLVVLFWLALGPCLAVAEAAERPRVGLVLGGGGAKGAAHIGVLQVLDELRVPVDCVAGTSMGALVGGSLAAGSEPSRIERDVLAIEWSRTVGGQGLRKRIPINRKLLQQTYSNALEFGIVDGGVTTPGGLIETQEIEGEIRRLVSGARYTTDFDDLPIPFRAVATDMVAGEMVVLDGGDLSVAMRASMAIPGAFAPVVLDGRVLADGGLMRNLPVDIARELCGDVVIAVWLSTPPPDRRDVLSALALVGRSLDVMIDANERAQIETLTSADVGISVSMGDVASSDFHRIAEAVELGRTAAQASADRLKRYAVSEDEYREWRHAVRVSGPGAPRTLADVHIVGLERVNGDYVRAQLRSALPGAAVGADDIEADVDRVFALGDFERVEHRITGDTDRPVLELRPVEKPWGPDFLRLDAGVSTDGDGDILGLLRMDHYRTWVNRRGGRWHNALQVGGQSQVVTDFYQPLDVQQRYFVQPTVLFENNREDLYLDGDRIARYFVRQLYGQLDVGMNVGTRAQVRAGLQRGWYEADVDTGIPGLPEAAPEADASAQLRVIYDTRDSVRLPTEGAFVNVRYVESGDFLGGRQDYTLVEGVVERAFGIRGNALSLIAGGASTISGEVPVSQQIQLGGIRTFPGLRPGELRGGSYWFAGTSYSWRLLDLQPLFGQALYAGLRLQAGRVGDAFDETNAGTLYGVSGSLNGRTPVGPFVLSLGFVDNGSWLVQLSLGRPLAEGSMLDDLR